MMRPSTVRAGTLAILLVGAFGSAPMGQSRETLAPWFKAGIDDALGVPSLEALPGLYREIDTEVRHLYRLAYVSSDGRRDGSW